MTVTGPVFCSLVAASSSPLPLLEEPVARELESSVVLASSVAVESDSCVRAAAFEQTSVKRSQKVAKVLATVIELAYAQVVALSGICTRVGGIGLASACPVSTGRSVLVE